MISSFFSFVQTGPGGVENRNKIFCAYGQHAAPSRLHCTSRRQVSGASRRSSLPTLVVLHHRREYFHRYRGSHQAAWARLLEYSSPLCDRPNTRLYSKQSAAPSEGRGSYAARMWYMDTAPRGLRKSAHCPPRASLRAVGSRRRDRTGRKPLS